MGDGPGGRCSSPPPAHSYAGHAGTEFGGMGSGKNRPAEPAEKGRPLEDDVHVFILNQ